MFTGGDSPSFSTILSIRTFQLVNGDNAGKKEKKD